MDRHPNHADVALRLAEELRAITQDVGHPTGLRREPPQAVGCRHLEARDEIERSQTTLLARRETVRQAQRAWELAGVRFTNGLSTQVEVSDARLQLQAAEVNEVQALRDYLVAIAALERAVGHAIPIGRRALEDVTPSSNLEGTH
jgi:hypothetical protein